MKEKICFLIRAFKAGVATGQPVADPPTVADFTQGDKRNDIKCSDIILSCC